MRRDHSRRVGERYHAAETAQRTNGAKSLDVAKSQTARNHRRREITDGAKSQTAPNPTAPIPNSEYSGNNGGECNGSVAHRIRIVGSVTPWHTANSMHSTLTSGGRLSSTI